jgi:phosphate transport system ATP-binding protein
LRGRWRRVPSVGHTRPGLTSEGHSDARVVLERVSCAYDGRPALREVSLRVADRAITAVLGPSGCGKSTLLRAINRTNDGLPGARMTGSILLDGRDVYAPGTDVVALRRRVGMVFQRPAVFAMSVFDNVAYGPRAAGRRASLGPAVESALRRAALWEEVRDRLDADAGALSLGQQQRLCIARALAVEPEVLLLDEPTSALDPGASARIEDLLRELRGSLTIVLATHALGQAARLAQTAAYLEDGALVEAGPAARVLSRPSDPRTAAFVSAGAVR